VSFDLLLPKMAEKWREVPGGSDHHPRQFSGRLLQGPEAELLAAWSRQNEEASGLRGWYWKLYGEMLRGKRVWKSVPAWVSTPCTWRRRAWR
jgi:hypothetical protein